MATIDLRKSISNPNALDTGNVSIQNRVASKTTQFSLFTTNENAVWAAKQQLMKESYPFALISVVVNRKLFRLQVGDCFKFSNTVYGISNIICRVLTISEKSLGSENITIHAVEDFYSTSNVITEYTAPGTLPEVIDPYNLLPIIKKTVIEAPYLITSDIEVIPLAAREADMDLGIYTYFSFDDGDSYSMIGVVANMRPYGTLVDTYPITYTIDTSIGFIVDFYNDDVDVIETTTWSKVLAATTNNAMLGDELITFQTITPVSGTCYKLEGIIRGRLDTPKTVHVEDEDFYWIGSLNITSLNHSEIISSAERKFKLVPYNINGVGDVSSATAVDLTIGGRAKKPYLPINFHANDGSYAARYIDNVVLTWSPMYRGTGAGLGSPGEVIAQTDREGLFRIEVWVSGSNVRDITDIDAVTWTYTEAMNLSDNGALASSITFKLFNFRVEDSTTYETDAVEVVCKEE